MARQPSTNPELAKNPSQSDGGKQTNLAPSLALRNAEQPVAPDLQSLDPSVYREKAKPEFGQSQLSLPGRPAGDPLFTAEELDFPKESWRFTLRFPFPVHCFSDDLS